ncbi:hypothetical protein RchiOBHm_Chr2g0140311 [Rosa chinensis]|uniref:Uncharacterized protein n=1 Tax=Rosa chinensis TaxID=74649 RepID=A0A2P6RXE5_ROSCH|nr:hypothetical protein RchiOBHm_Chr2g0140311 [Rosa chinensis]
MFVFQNMHSVSYRPLLPLDLIHLWPPFAVVFDNWHVFGLNFPLVAKNSIIIVSLFDDYFYAAFQPPMHEAERFSWSSLGGEDCDKTNCEELIDCLVSPWGLFLLCISASCT